MAKKTKKKAAKKAPKKSAKRPVKKPVKKVAKKVAKKAAKKPAKKPAARKAPAPRPAPGALSVQVDPALVVRLEALAIRMSHSLDQVLAQALLEFADNWEDHMQTVAVLSEGDDRIQLVVPPEDNPT